MWVYDPQRDAMTRSDFGGALIPTRVWSPDGQYVCFRESLGGGIFQARADGASQPQALTQSKTPSFRGLSRRMASGWPISKAQGPGKSGRCRWRIRAAS